MKKLLVSSVIFFSGLFSSSSFSEEVNPQNNQQEVVRVELKDVGCGPVELISANLKKHGLVPILMTISENYDTIVWKSEVDNSVVFVRYVDEKSACIMGIGVNVEIKNTKQKETI